MRSASHPPPVLEGKDNGIWHFPNKIPGQAVNYPSSPSEKTTYYQKRQKAVGTYPDVSNFIAKLNNKSYSKIKDLERIAMTKRLKDFSSVTKS